jgi:hypothetical protein
MIPLTPHPTSRSICHRLGRDQVHPGAERRRARLRPGARVQRRLGDERAYSDLAVQRPDPRERRVVEGLHERPVDHLVHLEHGHDALLDAGVEVGAALQLDPEAGAIAEALQHFLQRLEALAPEAPPVPGASVEPLELADGPLAHGPNAIRGALEREIVNDDGVAVLRQVNVHLERIRALLERQLERGDGVLRRVRGRAAVCDDERPFREPDHCLPHASRGTIEVCARPSSTCSAPPSGSARESTSACASKASSISRFPGRC